MHKVIARSLVLGGLLLALSAAGAGEKAPVNVAVVSLFDNTFHKLQRGLTEGSNESKDVSAWHIPEASETQMVALLKQKGIGQNVSVLAQALRATVRDGVEKVLNESARQAGYDTLVVIRPASYLNALFLAPGYGVFASGGLFGSPPACPYGVFMVETYRTADAERIAWRWGFSTFGEGPCVGLRSVPWKDSMSDYSDEDWKIIEAAIRKRIDDGMARAVDGLDFE